MALAGTSGPFARYGAVLFIEKEGFDELFDAVQLRERYDLAIMSTKGMSVTAARELVDALGRAGIPMFVAARLRQVRPDHRPHARHVSRRYTFQQPPKLIDLGLRLDDVQSLGLEDLAEEVEYDSKKTRERTWPRAARPRTSSGSWSAAAPGMAWCGRRVELNAMTSDQLVAWLEAKLQEHGVQKVVPDEQMLGDAYRRAWRIEQLRTVMVPEIARLSSVDVPVPANLTDRVGERIAAVPTSAWDDAVRAIARDERT